MSNKKYTVEYKEEAIRLIREGSESVSLLSAKLGVSKNTLYKWSEGRNKEGAEIGNDGLVKENKRLLKALRLAE